MKPMEKLIGLDVTDSMKKNIEVLNKAIDSIKLDNEAEAKERLEVIHSKVAEIEDYFWRPVDSPEMYRKLGSIASQLGDEEKARDYEYKTKLFEANDLEFKGRIEDFFGNKVKAVEYFAQALELVPDHELAKPAHEKALKRIEKARNDLRVLERKLETYEDDPKLWFRYGTAQLNLGEIQKAIHCFDRAIELNPSDSDAYARRGTAMESLGDFEGAKQFFEQALKLKPTSMIAKRGTNYAEFFLAQ
ncbi:MAG: tetratricopeptide repeat protein [Thermoplasmata archaeon]|nr:MAG: tetratricopeptide repeat protein [Thermoplasmata archaeon]